jgi:ATP-dependent DNA helicase RecG
VIKHATAGAFVFCRFSDGEWRLGLIEHPRLSRWMAPGGHVENDECQAQAAIREVEEESGLSEVRLLEVATPPLPGGFPCSHVRVPSPWWIIEQQVPADSHLAEPHVHVDHQYVAVVDNPEPARAGYIEVFRYRDDAAMTEDKRYRITGPLPHQVTEATARVTDEIGTDVAVVGLHRYELERIPLPVLREAVANAIVHRVYEDNRRCVRIEIRPTKVRIVSPGPLPEPVTVQNIREQNAARNTEVIATLRRFRLAEDAGRGVDVMQDVMAERLLEPPIFEADAVSVTVDLPLTSTVTVAERAWVGEIENRGDLRPRDRILLVHAARGRVLTNATARAQLGVDSTHARGALHRLRDAGLLVQEGAKSAARYRLADTITPPPGLTLSRATLHDLVLDLARQGPITNYQLRERLSLDRVEALRLLTDLVESGQLVRAGERRGAHYLLADRGGSAAPC